MADYKIANIKWLRDQGWIIPDTYSDSVCPTYAEITSEIPKEGVSSVVVNSTCTATSVAYTSGNLVCEVDITIILCYTPDIAIISEYVNQDKSINLNIGGVDTGLKALLVQQDGSFVKIPTNGDNHLYGSETYPYRNTTIFAYVGPTVTRLYSNDVGTGEWRSAFENFSNLEGVILADSVKEIQFGTFANCVKLKSLDFLNQVNDLGYSDFSGCTGLVGEIRVPDNVEDIGPKTFNDCTNITKLTFGENSKLKYFHRNSNYESIIKGCTSLTTIEFPKSLENIGYYACTNAPNLTTVTFPADSNLTEIDSNAFKGVTGIEYITLPNSLTSLGEHVFEDCTGLKEITIPGSVEKINTWDFDGCTSLTSITISNGVKTIGQMCLRGCTSLTSISFPSSVTAIEYGALQNCSSLTSITVNRTTPPTLDQWTIPSSFSGTIYVPSGSVDTYKAASQWSSFADKIQAIP